MSNWRGRQYNPKSNRRAQNNFRWGWGWRPGSRYTSVRSTMRRCLSQSGLNGRWLRRASCWKHIIKKWKWNSPKGQHGHQPGAFRALHAEQLLNSFKYAGFISHLFPLPKVAGLRTCLCPWSPERMYGLLRRGRWETPVPTTPKSCGALFEPSGLSEHLSRAADRRAPCRAAWLQPTMQKEPWPSTESWMSSYF